MNKRIEELLTQSSKEVWSNNPFNGSPEFEGYEVDQEKFAELLINECANLTKWQDCEMSAEKRIRLEIYHAIKDEFTD